MVYDEVYISLECARLLKQINYTWGYYTTHVYENLNTKSQHYDEYKKQWIDDEQVNEDYTLNQTKHRRNCGDFYLAPSQSSLQRWLREEKGIHIEISLENFSDGYIWQYAIYYIGEDCTNPSDFDGEFKSYENALEQGLIKVIKQIIENDGK